MIQIQESRFDLGEDLIAAKCILSPVTCDDLIPLP